MNYERFTDRLRRVMQHAKNYANKFGQDYIGSECVLLGLIKERQGVGGHVLAEFVDKDGKFEQYVVEKLKKSAAKDRQSVPLAPTAKKILDESNNAATSRGENHVGTEHILMGILRVQDSTSYSLIRLRLAEQEPNQHPDEIMVLLMATIGQPDTDQEEATGCDVDAESAARYRELAVCGLGRLRGDNLERARLQASRMTPDQLQQPWGQSGKTFQQLLDEYEQEAAEIDAAIAWVQSLGK